MMKLGKVVDEKSTETIELFTFDIADMTWQDNPSKVVFTIEKESFGSGGFRVAFKATSKTPGFKSKLWVVKKYREKAIDDINESNQTVEQHTKKVVQMHMLARNFTLKLEQELKRNDNLEIYGVTLTYKKIYMGIISGKSGDEWVTIEEFIDGQFTKYWNNDGTPCTDVDADIQKSAQVWHTFPMRAQVTSLWS